MATTRGVRTPHREALHRAWAAANQVEHCDTAGQYESRDFYVRVATMWATIALAEKGGTGAHAPAVPPSATDV
ncbi:hypothetical protein SEA_MARKY_65 [Streptomyces phage Marky]|nr:hypothetical protein SEA_MARKY_65 [Streptomyces phage Marky]